MKLFGLDKEQQILRHWSKNPSSAMDELYTYAADYLNGVCFRYIPGDDDRKDVLQEAFIKIFTQIGTFRYQGKGSLRAWMTRVTVNEALQWIRRQKRNAQVETVENLPEIPEEEPDTTLFTEDEIAEVIQRLPDGYRAVFNLYVVEGKSHKEISELLHIRPDSSASQLLRAKRMLAKMLKELKSKKDRN
ncbi:MAG: RNA polymerase sigma factor [Prevotella sp.]|jgi:RNA polymerase sigma factor (sigma-70 family)